MNSRLAARVFGASDLFPSADPRVPGRQHRSRFDALANFGHKGQDVPWAGVPGEPTFGGTFFWQRVPPEQISGPESVNADRGTACGENSSPRFVDCGTVSQHDAWDLHINNLPFLFAPLPALSPSGRGDMRKVIVVQVLN